MNLDGPRPKNHGKYSAFLREKGLRDETRLWLQRGQKLLTLEQGTGIVGISLAMMFTFPSFPHFHDDQIKEAILLLNEGQDQSSDVKDVKDAAEEFSEELEQYTNFYRKRMGLSSSSFEGTQN